MVAQLPLCNPVARLTEILLCAPFPYQPATSLSARTAILRYCELNCCCIHFVRASFQTVDFHVESIDDRPVTAEEDASTIRRLLQPLGGSKVCVVFVQPNLASDVGRADGADDELLLAP